MTKFGEKTKKGRSPKEFSFRVTAVTPCDGLTVTLQLDLAVTSTLDCHHPVTSRPSHPVMPVTGSGESVSPTSRNGFPDFSPTLSTCRDTRPEHVVKEAWPINRSKKEKFGVEEFLGKH